MYPADYVCSMSDDIEALLQHASPTHSARCPDVETFSWRCSYLKTKLPPDRETVYNVILLSHVAFRRDHEGD
jgi:hypothetical protein